MTAPESNEMATLPPPADQHQPTAAVATTTTTTTTAPNNNDDTDTSPLPPPAQPIPAADEAITAAPTTTAAGPSSLLTRKESEAIGAAAEDGASGAPKADPDAGPTVLITLLLFNGQRHPYKIDTRYLRKRGVTVEDNDPWNLPVKVLKELILRDWREDWEEKPGSPASIRLISMGLELQDGELLRDKRFNRTGPNIVHMVIKREIPEDEEIKDSKKRHSEHEGEGRRSSNCCGCVIL